MSSYTLRLLTLAGCCLLLVSCQDDAAAKAAAGATAADGAAEATADGEQPQTRFIGGLVQSALNLFNPCTRCNVRDQATASRCCREGSRECCLVLQGQGNPAFAQGGFNPAFGGGFNQGFRPGFNQGFNQGFNPAFGAQGHGGFGQPGFNTGFGVQGHRPGFQGHNPGFQGHNQGFNLGHQGGFVNHNINAGSTTKPGFCPTQGLFGPNIRSSPAAAAAAGSRRRRQAPGQEKAVDAAGDAAADDSGAPNTRFFNLFGCGNNECSIDKDCDGNLKCCRRNGCTVCTNPSFL